MTWFLVQAACGYGLTPWGFPAASRSRPAKPTRDCKSHENELANGPCRRKITVGEIGTKAILPEPRSIQKAISYQLMV
jgi:hypothetical protein